MKTINLNNLIKRGNYKMALFFSKIVPKYMIMILLLVSSSLLLNSSPTYGSVCIDNAAPNNPTSVSSTSHIEGSWSTDTTIDMTWSGATDVGCAGVSGYSYSFTQGATDIPNATQDTTGTTATSLSLAEGAWYFHIRTRDNAGNWNLGAVHSGPYYIDNTKPKMYQIENINFPHTCSHLIWGWCDWTYFPIDAGIVNPTIARLKFSNADRYRGCQILISDGADIFEFSDGSQWNNDPGGCGAGSCDDVQADGVYSPWIINNGKVGVRLYDDVDVWCLGTDPKYTTAGVEYDRTYGWYGTDPAADTVLITFDPGAGSPIARIDIDENCDGTWTNNVWTGSSPGVKTGFNPWSAASKGQKKYCVRVWDSAGNSSDIFYNHGTEKMRFYYRKDTTPPSTPGTPTTTTPTTNRRPEWDWTAPTDSSGVAGYYVYVGTTAGGTDIVNGAWVTTNSYTHTVDVTDGTRYCRVRAKDNAGNLSSYSGNGSVCIDNAAPNNPTSVSSTSHTVGSWSTDTTIEMTWSGATDVGCAGVSGYSYSFTQGATDIPNATQDTTGTTATSPSLAEGAWYFHIGTRDNAENWNLGAVHRGPYYIDNTLPKMFQIQTINNSHTCSHLTWGWCDWTYFPIDAGIVNPTIARLKFSNADRYRGCQILISDGADTFEFSDGSQWNNDPGGCGAWSCDDVQADGVYSPWIINNGKVGVRLYDDVDVWCLGTDPKYTTAGVEYDRTYGWYGTDPAADTVLITFDPGAGSPIARIDIDENCDGTWTNNVWTGSSPGVKTGFNPWSAASKGQKKYCVRVWDSAGNSSDIFYNHGTEKMRFWYRKDTAHH